MAAAALLSLYVVKIKQELRKSERLRQENSLRSAYASQVNTVKDIFPSKGISEAQRLVLDAKLEAERISSDARIEASRIIDEANRERTSAAIRASNDIENARKEKGRLTEIAINLRTEIAQKKEEIKILDEALALRSDESHLTEVGYYEPVYGFEDLPRYEDELTKIRQSQRDMLLSKGERGDFMGAAFSTTSLSFNGSASKGRKLIAKVLNLMLRAFNGECDSFISRVNYRNIEAMKRRLKLSFDQINKLAKFWHCEISDTYLRNRMEELQLVFEYEEAKQREKEEQARIREQIREEERAAREAEKRREDIEKEESRYMQALEKAKQDIDEASEREKEALSEKISRLQKRIAEMEEKKRAISQAMLTRTGHVYIISNIGSFGDNVFKIGMTRRLEPMDRVKELGDASVPFPFDIHAMIRSSDAPALENAIHKRFSGRRLNLENERKEFFRVSIEEIKSELLRVKEELGIESELRLTLIAEAKQYRLSEIRRRHLEASRSNDDQPPAVPSPT